MSDELTPVRYQIGTYFPVFKPHWQNCLNAGLSAQVPSGVKPAIEHQGQSHTRRLYVRMDTIEGFLLRKPKGNFKEPDFLEHGGFISASHASFAAVYVAARETPI